MKESTRLFEVLICLLALLSACASNPAQGTERISLETSAAAGEVVVLLSDARVKLTRGSIRRAIPANTHWRVEGQLPQGTVYNPIDWELVVRGKHSFEGFLVVSDREIVGIYLPFEEAFVVAKKPVPIKFQEK